MKGTGFVAYDLQGPSRVIYPKFAPIRNRIGRNVHFAPYTPQAWMYSPHLPDGWLKLVVDEYEDEDEDDFEDDPWD
jgi:hypothetical protein